MEWNESRQRWENGRSKVVTAAREQGLAGEFIDWVSPEAAATNPHWAPIFDEDPLTGLDELKDLMEQPPGNFDVNINTDAQEAGLTTVTEDDLRAWVDRAARAA